MRTLSLPAADALLRGRFHGEMLRTEIQEIAAIRCELACSQGPYRSEASLLATAERHLPILRRWDPLLYDELIGIAQGASSTPARIVVLNHYTDLKDIDPTTLSDSGATRDDECTAILASTPEGGYLAQTWDMHGSALPYVIMLHVPTTAEGPEAWLLSIAGCMGMAGMNAHGVAMTINNLKSHDARIGLVWPAMVRGVLKRASAEEGRDVVIGAPLGSGHHYWVADARHAYGIETSGARRYVWSDLALPASGLAAHHENHCVSAEIAAVSSISETSTTLERARWLQHSLSVAPIESGADLWNRLGTHEGFPRSLCTHLSGKENPHGMNTCGGISMNLDSRRLWAAPGCIHGVEPLEFAFDDEPSV